MTSGDKKGLPSLYGGEDEQDIERTRLADDLRLGPRATQSPWLMVVGGRRSVGRLFELRRRMTIGRADADIVIDEDGVSRSHAEVEVLPGGHVRVSDLGSSNGIRVNGRLAKIQSLRDGERMRLGDAVLILVHLDGASSAIAANLRSSADAALGKP